MYVGTPSLAKKVAEEYGNLEFKSQACEQTVRVHLIKKPIVLVINVHVAVAHLDENILGKICTQSALGIGGELGACAKTSDISLNGPE